MKVVVAKEILHEKLTLLEKVSGKHATLPVLRGIHLRASKNTLTLSATNLDVGLSVSLSVKVEHEGEAVVPASLVSSIVGSLARGGSVTCSVEEGHFVVSGGGSTARITTLPAEEFPALPQVEDGVRVSVPARSLVSVIRSVWFCASTSTIKPELASVYLFTEGNSLVAVATDSFRLAEKRVRLSEPLEMEPLLIPIRNTPDLLRVLEGAEDDVELTYNQNQLSFTQGDTYCTTRLTDGTFPDYRQIIPKEYVVSVVALTQEVAASIRKAALFAGSFNQVTLAIDPSTRSIEVRAASSEVGDVTDTLEGVIEGEALTINFNQKYLVDGFQSITSDSTSLSCAGPGRPMVMRGVGDDSYLYLVMPMNR